MAIQTIRRVPIWSGSLRLLHWAMAAAVLGLLGSGWLLHGPSPALSRAGLEEAHGNLAYLLIALLLVRVYLLLFGRGPAQWRDFLPARGSAAVQVLRFYGSLGRSPLPAYYAHNPLWGPVYLFLYALLVVQFLTGVLMFQGLHLPGGYLLAVLALGHVVTAVVHDWRGTASDVSALINGHRIFVVNPVDVPTRGTDGPVEVRLDVPRPGDPPQ